MSLGVEAPVGNAVTSELLAGLAALCGRMTVVQVDDTAEQLDCASRLLREVLGRLRQHFGIALTAGDDAQGRADREHHLRAAMIALQCEDTIGQMLDSVRLRTAYLGQVLGDAGGAFTDLCHGIRLDGLSAGRAQRIADQLRETVDALEAIGRAPAPVTHPSADSGPIDLF